MLRRNLMLVIKGCLDSPSQDYGLPSPDYGLRLCSIFVQCLSNDFSVDKLLSCPHNYTTDKPLSKVCPLKYLGQAHESHAQQAGHRILALGSV